MLTKLTEENVKSFSISEKHILILCDAEWNKNKELADKFKQLTVDWEKNPGKGEFAFGEIDIDDKGLWEFLQEWKVSNVPCVLYIWNDIVFPMKSMKTGNHNIKEHMVNLLVEEMMKSNTN